MPQDFWNITWIQVSHHGGTDKHFFAVNDSSNMLCNQQQNAMEKKRQLVSGLHGNFLDSAMQSIQT